MLDNDLFYKDDNQSDTGSDRQEQSINEQIAMDVDRRSPARTTAGPTGAYTNTAISYDANKLVKSIMTEISKMTPTTRKYEAAELRAMVDFASQVDGLTIESLSLTEQIATMIADKPEQLRRTPLYQNAIRALMHERENRGLRENEAILTHVHNGTGVSIQKLRDAVAASGDGEVRCPKGTPMGPPLRGKVRRASAVSGMAASQQAAALLRLSYQPASPFLGHVPSLKRSDSRRPPTSNESSGHSQRFTLVSPSQRPGNPLGHSYHPASASGVDDDMDIDHDEHPEVQSAQNTGFFGRRDGGSFSQPGGVRQRTQRTEREELAMRQLMSGHFVDDDGNLPKRPRSNRGQDNNVESASGRRGSVHKEGAAGRYDNEGFDQPVGRERPPQGGKGRYADGGYGLHALPRGNRGYTRHLDAPRDAMGRGAQDYDDDDRRQRGRQLDHFPQDLNFVEPYVAKPYVEDHRNYNGRSHRDGMSQERNQYPLNRPRGAVRSRSRSPLPRTIERRQSRSFAQDDQEYYKNMAFPGKLPARGPRVRGAPLDERALMRQQLSDRYDMPYIKQEDRGHERARGSQPDREPIFLQQGGAGRQSMSQKGHEFGRGRPMPNEELASSPPMFAIRPAEGRPQPTPSSSTYRVEAAINQLGDEERDDQDGQSAEAERGSSVDNGSEYEDESMAEAPASTPANNSPVQQRAYLPIQDPQMAADAKRHHLVRAQDYDFPDRDRALQAAIGLRNRIGYEWKDRKESNNTKARVTVSPLDMTQQKFNSLSQAEKRVLLKQRVQRDNLYIRACEMILGRGAEDCKSDIGPHSISPRSQYDKSRLSGNSAGLQNPDNIFAVLEFEMFNTDFQQIAAVLNAADRFLNIKRKQPLNKVAIHGRYNRNAEVMADKEDRAWTMIGSREKAAKPDAKKGSKKHTIIKEEPAEAEPAAPPAPYQPLEWTDRNEALLNEALSVHSARKAWSVAGYMGDKLGRPIDVDDIRRRLDPRLDEVEEEEIPTGYRLLDVHVSSTLGGRI